MRLPRVALALLAAAVLTGSAGGAEEDAGATSGRLGFEVHARYTASLVHVIDNLAGASPGKTVDVYRSGWLRRFGSFSGRDRVLLARWRRVMLGGADTARRPLRPPRSGLCVPAPSRTLSRRQRLAAMALNAESNEAFLAAAGEILPPEDVSALAAALEHFEPRFRRLWARMGYLEGFAERLRQFLARRQTRALSAALVRFFGSPPVDRPARLHLVGLLGEQQGTHAEAFGNDLLLEIRPHDTPRSQVQVIFHELSHDLFHRLPADRRAAWARSFLERGPRGALAWGLSHEALPTALGQGVAEARLARSLWKFRRQWYHLPEVDLYAHAIYPVLRRALDRGATMDRTLAGALVDALPERNVEAAPVLAYFVDGAFAGPPTLRTALDALARRAPTRDAALVELGPGDGADFLRRYTCMPLLALLDPAATEQMRAIEPTVPAWPTTRPDAEPLAGMIVPGRRASGAAALWIYARDEAAAETVAGALVRLPRWPERPVPVPYPEGAARTPRRPVPSTGDSRP